MALRRYQHKFPQPLEIDQERVQSSLNSSITATNLTATNSNITTETIRKLSTNNFFNSATPDYTPSVEALTIIADPNVSQGAIAHIRNNNVSVNDADVFGGLKFSSAPGADFVIGKSTQLGNGYLQVRRENGTTLASMDGAGNLTINSGNLVIGTAGKGIDFSATANATGANTELLDDYETGTWTPTWSFAGGGSVSYTSQVGTYTKIGRCVYITARIAVSTISAPSGQAFIRGLPFVPVTVGAQRVYGASVSRASAWNTAPISGVFFETNSGEMEMYKAASTANTTTDLLGSDFSTNCMCSFFGYYEVS